MTGQQTAVAAPVAVEPAVRVLIAVDAVMLAGVIVTIVNDDRSLTAGSLAAACTVGSGL